MSGHSLMPPGGPLEVVFSFDTTGSMYGFLEQVRRSIQELIQRLQADIPGIRLAVLAHGDYCDTNTYVTKWTDFTSDVKDLCDFVRTIERTGGGDTPECYELAMRKVRTELSWSPGSRKALVLIGDAEPHEPDYRMNTENIDWRQETRDLASMGVTIYAVQCNKSPIATPFYQTIAKATSGRHLELNNIETLFDVLMAVCYRESDDTAMLAAYEKEVRARDGPLLPNVDAIFESLRGDGTGSVSGDSTKSSPWPHFGDKSSTDGLGLFPFGPVSSTDGLGLFPFGPKKPVNKKPSPPSRDAKPKKRTRKPTIIDAGLEKYKLKNLPLLKRENVPDNHFALRLRSWSAWTVVIRPEVTKEDRWTPRGNKRGGKRRHVLPFRHLDGNSDHWNLFEVAVQAPGRKRRVVFSCVSKRDLTGNKWETLLLSPVSRHVNHVIGQSCNILMRCCKLQNNMDKLDVKRSLKRYDYAWKRAKVGSRSLSHAGITFTSMATTSS